MPLYNEQTNLAGQGRFSPGVTYYAGIRAPSQPIPSMPKSDASFNIDLSSIGQAMIAAKESETKLGMAAIEMEQNLQLAAMEDARARELTDKELAMKWQIASMNNDTELLKLQKERESKEKDNSQALANNAFIRSMRDASIARTNGKLSQEAFAAVYNKNIDDIQNQYPNAELSKIGEAYNKLYPNLFQFSTKSALAIDENIEDTRIQAIKNTIANSPRLQSIASYNPSAAWEDVINTNTAFDRMLDASLVENNPRASEEEKAVAKKVAADAGGTIAEKALIDFLTDQRYKKDIQNSSNLFRYENGIIEEGTALLMAAGNRTYGDAREYTVNAWNKIGGRAFVQGYADVAKNTKELADNMWQTKVSNNKLYMANNNQLGMFMSLPSSIQSKVLVTDLINTGGALSDALGAYALGSVVEDKEGNYMYLQNLKVLASFSKEEANKLMEITGATTPIGAIRSFMLSQAINSYDKYKRKEISESGFINYSEAGAMVAQGSEDPGKALKDYDEESLKRIQDNESKYVESNPVGFKAVLNLCEEKGARSPNCSFAYTEFQINNQLTDEEKLKFNQKMKYIYPENFGNHFDNPILKTLAEKLKGSEMIIKTFPNDDVHVGIDYIDKGIAGPAGVTKRWEYIKEILPIINSTDTTKEQKIDYLQAWYVSRGEKPLRVIQADNTALNTAAKAYRDWKEYMFYGVNKLAEVESKEIDKASYKRNNVTTLGDVLEGSVYVSKGKLTDRAKEDITEIKKDLIVAPTGNPFNEEQYPFEINGDEVSNTLTEIVEEDGEYYLRPTIGDTSKHFGGYSSLKAAEDAEKIIHAYLEGKTQRYISEKRHSQWLESQPVWKKLLEALGLAQFKEE